MTTRIDSISANLLARLEGQEFQDAVGRLLTSRISDFQAVPPKPSGDGGVDGISNRQTVAYCCYGLEQNKIRTKKDSQIKDAVCRKFREDLRRILELELETGSRALRHAPNEQLARIHTGERKIQQIYCVCNWFEHHGIIGTLQGAFDSYLRSSRRNFVEASCCLVIEGPKELIRRLGADDQYLLTLEYPRLFDLLHGPGPRSNRSGAQPRSAFDAKFDALAVALPDKAEIVEDLRKDFFREWLEYIELMKNLDDAYPNLHGRMVSAVRLLRSLAREKSTATTPAGAIHAIGRLRDKAEETLKKGVFGDAGIAVDKAARLVISGLVGECHLDWR